MEDTVKKISSTRNSLIVLAVLGSWLVGLLGISIWFQSQYVKPFAVQPTFLQTNQTQAWFESLNETYPQLAPYGGQAKVIQFWQPDCLCNQFARPHALSAQMASKEQNLPHITLVPARFAEQLDTLKALNPETTILAVDTGLLPHIPNAPSLVIEKNDGDIHYFGPLGFGAFCGQASTSVIDRQINSLALDNAQPFFNVIGQGCFCPWQ